jgi:hypothetical protein
MQSELKYKVYCINSWLARGLRLNEELTVKVEQYAWQHSLISGLRREVVEI